MFKNVLWKETLWLNCLRASFGGFMLGFIGIFLFGYPIFAPIICLLTGWFWWPIIAIPITAITRFIEKVLPFGWLAAGWRAVFALIMVSMGDPFVYLLNKYKPEWVPVDDPPKFSLSLFYPVTPDGIPDRRGLNKLKAYAKDAVDL